MKAFSAKAKPKHFTHLLLKIRIMNKYKETTDSTRNTSILGEVERQGGARKTKEIKRKRTITKKRRLQTSLEEGGGKCRLEKEEESCEKEE